MNRKILTFEQKDNISFNEVGTFLKEMLDFIDQEADYFILNLENVSYINSEGLGVIANCVLKLKKRNKNFMIGGIQPNIKEIFRLVRFDYFIDYFNTHEEAIESIQRNKYG